MRRILALTSLALLAACGGQGGDAFAETEGMAEQAEAPPTDEVSADDSAQVAESDASDDGYYDEGDYDDGGYAEDESGGEFGDPTSEGDSNFADASAPMDDARGIDPHAEMGGEEYSEDY